MTPQRTTEFAYLVDIYRTLADLAGLPSPDDTIQGASLRPLLNGNASQSRMFSVAQFPRCSKGKELYDSCKHVSMGRIPFMGYSIRVHGWRFTEWYNQVKEKKLKANFHRTIGANESTSSRSFLNSDLWNTTFLTSTSGTNSSKSYGLINSTFLGFKVDHSSAPVATELYAYDESQLFNYDALEMVNVAGEKSAECVAIALRLALHLYISRCQFSNHEHCNEEMNKLIDTATNCADPMVHRPGLNTIEKKIKKGAKDKLYYATINMRLGRSQGNEASQNNCKMLTVINETKSSNDELNQQI
jgi:hypothetical protein